MNFLRPIPSDYIETDLVDKEETSLPQQILSDDFQLELLENEYELINVGKQEREPFGLSTVKSMGSQERGETNTKLLYSDNSQHRFTAKSNDISKRRYERCPVEERVHMGTELSEPIIAYKEMDDPYTKYIVHVPSRLE